MELNSKIYIAGHRGLVGSAIFRELQKLGYKNIILRTHNELELYNYDAVNGFFDEEKPEYVFLAAAKVGGIHANNTYPADFIYDNLNIQNNIIHLSLKHGIKKLLFLGSSCIYPKMATQSIKEEYLLSGPLEPTNEPYALAKIAGIKMCQSYNRQYGTNFIACMPTNLYGINDNFELNNSHVLPAMIHKFHIAKTTNQPTVTMWGDGSAMREFLFVDDAAKGCIYLMQNYNPTKEQNEKGDMFLNIGTGIDITIKQLAEIIQKIVGYEGEIIWDTSKPNGTPRKLLDVSKINELGWKHETDLEKGIEITYKWFLENYDKLKK